MTTGRINQVTIVPGHGHPWPVAPPKRSRDELSDRGGSYSSDPAVQDPPTESSFEAPHAHPIAPTGVLQGTVRDRYGALSLEGRSRPVPYAPQLKDTSCPSRAKTDTGFG